jgi:hypothetical protein
MGVPSSTAAAAAAAFGAAAFFDAALLVFLAGLASSGCSGRVRPSFSARRRKRSACASMMLEDWLFASTPIFEVSSNSSLFVIPSSLASSCTRMFFAKLIQPFVGVGLPDAGPATDQFRMFFVVTLFVP